MKTLDLKPKGIPEVGLELEITPEMVSGKTLDEIRKITVFAGNAEGKLGDFFIISGDVSEKPEEQRLVFDGDMSKVKRIGQGMTGGEIVVKGNAGLHLGEGMTGGKIVVEGGAGGWIGTDMTGGEILIMGNAGSYVGCSERGRVSGMTGGSITVDGKAGHYVGIGLNGGDILIKGPTEQFVGSYMKGGTIEAKSIGLRPGYAMSGGRIIAEEVDVPFYFSRAEDDDTCRIYEGDQSFGGKGRLCVKK